MYLKRTYSKFSTGHGPLDRAIECLQKEGFEIDTVMQGNKTATLSMNHAGLNEVAFVDCSDLQDEAAGTIKRGSADLEKSPQAMPLAAYKAHAIN